MSGAAARRLVRRDDHDSSRPSVKGLETLLRQRERHEHVVAAWRLEWGKIVPGLKALHVLLVHHQ